MALASLRRMTVRQRLSATVAVLTSLVLAVVGLMLHAVELHRIDRAAQDGLNHQLDELRIFRRDAIDPATNQRYTSPDRLLEAFLGRNLAAHTEQLYAFLDGGQIRVQGHGDDALQGSAAFQRLAERLRFRGGVEDLQLADAEYRVAVQPVTGSGETAALVVTRRISVDHAALHHLLLTYTLLAALSVLLVTGFASWIAGRMLTPMRDLRDTARGISEGGDIGRRLEVTGDDDLADLQRTFNAMLDRLENAVVTQRQLLDDAGHELRTPLTVLRGHLEVLDVDDPADVEATRRLLLDETDRMARLVNDLLVLAKARQPDFVRLDETDVAQLTTGVLDRARGLGDRRWMLDEAAGGTAVLDGQRITQALLQLADNAVRHTGPADEIGIGSRRAGDTLELWVRDSGPGVAAELRPVLFERFTRGAHDDEHFGLGLSIVQAIAQAHGGEAVLDDTEVGATFRLRLPWGED